ncbi:MAG: sigma-70 family RNA polymerase sigma factor [Chakrabartia sp.]
MLQHSLSPAQKYAARDLDALVTETMPLVRRIAWHVHARVASAIEVEDLIQIGMIALVEAARSYEDRGHAFSTYASMRVRGAMIDHLRKEARMARSAIQRRRDVEATRAKLEQRLRRSPSDSEMAAEMGLSIAAFQEVTAAIQPLRTEAIDEAYSDHLMVFADEAELPDETLSRAQLAEALNVAIDQLTEREKTILQLYFVEELNLDEIGLVLGVGAARVCQIKKAALTKMRALMDRDADF